VEAQQILDMLLDKSKKRNHPAVLMWVGHTDALKVYINHCIRQWLKRGKNCQLQEYNDVDEDTVVYPWWFTWPQLHLSHKCSLLRKDPEYYSEKFTLTTKESKWLLHGYIWPSKLEAIDINRRYKPEQVCVPIGSGAPAQYRWSVNEVIVWNKNRLVNPRTGRAIKAGTKTGIYNDIEKAYNYYLDEGKL
jgi:hypothetical protein